MIILTIRTDKPEAEIGLYHDKKQLAYETWPAHRQLAETLHNKIQALLQSQNKNWQDITGIVVFEGPGSFTGLRIGISAANALSYSLNTPIVGSKSDNWLDIGIDKLLKGENSKQIIPFYGAEANITTPKK
jgi:tRNA threonylcarbamoyladenosine biosynthesis protein TsaB